MTSDLSGFELALAIHQIVNELRAELPRLPAEQRFAAFQAKLAPLSPALATAVTAVFQLGQDLASDVGDHAAAGDGALAIWQRKLEYLREQDAVSSDFAQRFTLRELIREAEQRIRELGGG